MQSSIFYLQNLKEPMSQLTQILKCLLIIIHYISMLLVTYYSLILLSLRSFFLNKPMRKSRTLNIILYSIKI